MSLFFYPLIPMIFGLYFKLRQEPSYCETTSKQKRQRRLTNRISEDKKKLDEEEDQKKYATFYRPANFDGLLASKHRLNYIFVGGARSGKTSTLNNLISMKIPTNERKPKTCEVKSYTSEIDLANFKQPIKCIDSQGDYEIGDLPDDEFLFKFLEEVLDSEQKTISAILLFEKVSNNSNTALWLKSLKTIFGDDILS